MKRAEEEKEYFERVVSLIRELRAPHGCPWDREQTLPSIAPLILEEVYEVIEALGAQNVEELCEEVGDVLWDVLFICSIAEDEGKFTLANVLEHLAKKIIRRHPHVWGDEKTTDTKKISELYDSVKREDYKHKRSSVFDGIVASLPALTKALKVVKKAEKNGVLLPEVTTLAEQTKDWDEQAWGEFLFKASIVSRRRRIDLEQALRVYVQKFIQQHATTQ